MTTYKTGNAVGSTDPRDLYDNAQNIDEWANSTEKHAHPDRLGVERLTLHGMEQEFASFLASSGYLFVDDEYGEGIELTSYNQVIRADGELWRLSGSIDLPYTTTGSGMPEGGAFLSIGDAALRQELLQGKSVLVDAASVGVSAEENARQAIERLSDEIGDAALRVRSVVDFGAVGDGVTDDTPAFQACADFCMTNSALMRIPHTMQSYLVTASVVINQKLVVEGETGGHFNVYNGPQRGGSRIRFTGTGALFAADTDNLSSLFPLEGLLFRNLTIIGTAAGSHGIRVGMDSDVANAAKIKSGVTIENISIEGFKNGRGVALHWCFSNVIRDLFVQDCGMGCYLHYAHGTRFFGGNLEHSLVGLDCRVSYAVSLFGTVIEGCYALRSVQFGLSVPADMFVWSGWDGSGSTGASRTNPSGYSGTGVRNLGSTIALEGIYWEYNDYNIVCEADSFTTVNGGIAEMDPPNTRSFAQIGAGVFDMQGVDVRQGTHASFVSVVQIERDSGPRVYIGESCKFPPGLATGKLISGPFWAGETNIFLSSLQTTLARKHREWRTDGQAIIPTTSGSASVDLYPHASSNKMLHVVNAAGTVTYSFADPDLIRSKSGTRLCLHVIATAAITVAFGSAFRATSGTYGIPVSSQAIFEFEYSNGAWIMCYAPVVTTL